MSLVNTKPRRRRLKSGKKWPTWLRSARLLKWFIFIGVLAYRLWRIWRALKGPHDS